MSGDRPRAVRVAVDGEEPLIGGRQFDYADAFEIRASDPDDRSAEELTRQALEHAHPAVRRVVAIAHRHLLRIQLGPASSPDHVLGWRITTSEPDVLLLEAKSSLLGAGAIVVRQIDQTRTRVSTYLFFERQWAARILWAATGPVHRKVAPYLLEGGATAAARARAAAGHQ